VDVSVIIVTYNSAACIEACLASVAEQKGVTAETIVVDNASADNTAALVRKFPVRLLANADNVGYGQANNRGFAVSEGRFVYLLNPDARLTDPGALARLCGELEAHPAWGMAGNRILSPDGKDEIGPAFSYPAQQHVHRDFSKLPGRIAWILGASMIIRRQVYAALDGFDPGFFLYCEETDFCLRLRQMGHEIGFVDGVTVRHVGGASEAGSDPYDVCERKMTSMLRFRRKHYPPADAVRLARRDRYRARFRMLWYGLWARLRPAPSTAWRKHRQYRAIWEISRKFLEGRGA
jgi:N-acetylglucosaminyl-diphospho-decaprenol L-rhamnosyltransferase